MFEKMYFRLFNVITDALLAMEAQNYGTAKHYLLTAQLECEEFYIENAEKGAEIGECDQN